MAKENKPAKPAEEKKVNTEFVDQRTFRYQKGAVNLSFTLAKRKEELADFIDLLGAAQVDVLAWMKELI